MVRIRKLNLAGFLTIAFAVVIVLYCGFFRVSASDVNDKLSQSLAATATEKTVQDMKQLENDLNLLRQEIARLQNAGLFQDAEKKLNELRSVYDKLGNSKYINVKYGSFDNIKTEFYKKWADSLEGQASEAYSSKQWDKSLELSKAAIDKLRFAGIDVKGGAVPENQIANNSALNIKQKDWDDKLAVKNYAPEEVRAAKSKDEKFIKAQTFIKNREFAKARDVLEEILILDPYDYQAMYMLKNVYGEIYQAGKSRAEADAIALAAQAAWKSNEPLTTKQAEQITVSPIEFQSESLNQIARKLKDINIDKIDFDSASVSAVVTYLNKESKRLDKVDGVGINIVLKLDKAGEGQTNNITMSLDNVPIGEAIKYLCSAAGLKYRIEEHAVIIGNDAINEMETKFYLIKSGLINSIVSNLNIEETKTGDKKMVDIKQFSKKDLNVNVLKVTTDQLKNYFVQRGIPFPQGAKIAWDEKTSMLIITNTPDNNRLFENLLKEIDIEIPLVQIESRFVQIDETELEALAFKWNLYSLGKSGTLNGNQFLNGSSPFSINPFFDPSTTLPLGNDEIIRDPGGTPLISDLNYSANIGGTNYSLSFWTYALDQTQTLEVLTTSKVTTKSGATAVIKMITEKYFPETWGTPTVSSAGINMSSPTFGDPTDLGIIFTVTPTVSPNNYTVFLDLYPQVVDFYGWIDYSYNISYYNGTDTTPTLYPQPLKMPQIEHRDVKTHLKIFDGETAILGGIITDETSKIDDKYPFLGDVPLVGRLFRSKIDSSKKVNLMMFITIRLITPDGTPLHKDINKGLSEYFK